MQNGIKDDMKTFKFDSYGEAFGHGDIIGCLLDRKKNEIVFYKDGKDLGICIFSRTKISFADFGKIKCC